MNSPEPIKIGLPINSRISEDCKAVSEILKLEGPRDRLTSKLIPGAVFRPTRVNDIAAFLREGIFSLGIIGDDTAIENDLERPYQELDKNMWDWSGISIGERTSISPKNKLLSLGGGATKLVIFAKPEDLEGIKWPYELLAKGYMVTPYPRTAGKILSKLYMRAPMLIPNQGGTEAMVANRDGGAIMGYDVVRSGNTLRDYGLIPWKETVYSSPGIWQSPNIRPDQRSQFLDVKNELLYRLKQISVLEK